MHSVSHQFSQQLLFGLSLVSVSIYPTIGVSYDRMGLGEKYGSEIRPTSLQRSKGPSRAWPLFGGFTVVTVWCTGMEMLESEVCIVII